MSGYVKCFDNNKTMSFKVNDNNLLKKYTKIWKEISSLMDIEFDSEPVYGDNDNFKVKKKKEFIMQIFIINNARFCYQKKQNVLSSNRRMQIQNKKDQNRKSY